MRAIDTENRKFSLPI